MVTLCGTSVFAFAQDFGKALVTGSFGYHTTKTEGNSPNPNNSDYKLTTFHVSPKIGFFISPKVAVGFSAGLETRSTLQNRAAPVNGQFDYYITTDKTHSYDAGPFVRIYQAIGSRAAFFGQAAAYYSYGKSKYEGETNFISTSTSKGGGVSIAPGFVFFPSSLIGLEFTMGNIGYSRTKTEYENSGDTYTNKGFNAGFGFNNLTLGISLYLGRTASE